MSLQGGFPSRHFSSSGVVQTLCFSHWLSNVVNPLEKHLPLFPLRLSLALPGLNTVTHLPLSQAHDPAQGYCLQDSVLANKWWIGLLFAVRGFWLVLYGALWRSFDKSSVWICLALALSDLRPASKETPAFKVTNSQLTDQASPCAPGTAPAPVHPKAQRG